LKQEIISVLASDAASLVISYRRYRQVIAKRR